jgi:uncharacterized protein (TIGR03118 family)
MYLQLNRKFRRLMGVLNGGGDVAGGPGMERLEGRRLLAAAANAFVETDLVSNRVEVPALHTDPNLVNGWGVAINQTNGAIWIGDADTGKSTAYTASGVQTGPVVNIPHGASSASAAPTGVVYNGTNDFVIAAGASSAPAQYLFASEDGTVSGWNFGVDAQNAILKIDRSADEAVYKGLAIAKMGNRNLLYVADFHRGKINVFKGDFTPASVPGKFKDTHLPAGYAPFNIQNVGNKLYVAFAKQDADKQDEVAGAGLGIVDVFNTNGQLEKRLVSGGKLNAPWAVVAAPAGFGPFAKAILVGNFGDGRINAFNASNGKFLGVLKKPDGTALAIDGLWGLQFGNGTNAGTKQTLFFAAGPHEEADGLFGKIEASGG